MAPTAFWREAVVKPDAGQLAPVTSFPFQVKTTDRVATAGSCFAQHIARHLSGNGFNYYVPEIAHPIMPGDLAQRFNYGTFSARYGNIYTSRQLLQLFQRAEGKFDPRDRFWHSSDGSGFVDPYRPAIQPTPFTTIRALEEDRNRHLAAVRKMMRELDVFVFTLGLTECWVNKQDGAVYPLCPGTSGGAFDPHIHQFVNLRVEDVRAELIAAFEILRSVNPAARIILTVSPVPLKATASGDHVLSATTYSKSVLRAAAGEVSKTLNDVVYFPSYEIITGSYSRGRYFSANLRDVEAEGVAHVMRVFGEHMTEKALSTESAAENEILAASSENIEMTTANAAGLICEEEMLEMERMLALRS
ncbi:GSCFA domain-containing protein [Sphingobium limneticum]|nr:GSCFA domain-containing protein [Sphingobium limneticum]